MSAKKETLSDTMHICIFGTKLCSVMPLMCMEETNGILFVFFADFNNLECKILITFAHCYWPA